MASMRFTELVLGGCFFLACLCGPAWSETRKLQTSCDSCSVPHEFDPTRHKETYDIGVLNFRGPDSAYAQHNETFSNYLTATAGKRFDPPISFRMNPVDFQTMFDVAAESAVDYLYVSPSPFACVEAEYGAQSLVSHISRRVIGENTYDLPKFAGVIATRADNNEINTLQDLKDKVVASAAISSFGGGQMQFREVQNAGLSYINDPKQVVFTGNQASIVNGVINGDFDVGFVRTDQIERTVDADGKLVDPSLLKILQPKDNKIDGVPFPFAASTQLYPEWNLAALDFVPADVSAEVQAAMLALVGHAKTGQAIQECKYAYGDDSALCEMAIVAPEARCDTTEEIAVIAQTAMTNGGYAGFRTSQSYIEIRAMLQDTAFISKDEETNVWRCARPAFLYEAIACPPGHFKRSEEEVKNGCANSGLECKEGYECVCNPCVKAFAVDVYPIVSAVDTGSGSGCAKMSLCGSTEQTKPLTFRATDNKNRVGSTMTVTVHEGDKTRSLEVAAADSNVYEFSVTAKQVGILILEIRVDGEQIPESPLRVQIEEKDCSEEYLLDLHEADEYGECVCQSNTVSFGDSCVPLKVLLPAILCPAALIVAIAVYFYVRKKTRDADSVWYVKSSELHYSSPPEVIGQGTFGLVLLAEYRGTKVAVKRVLPPLKSSRSVGTSVSPGSSGANLKSGILKRSVVKDSNPGDPEGPKMALDAVQNAIDIIDEEHTTEFREDDEELGVVAKERKETHRGSVDGRSPAVFVANQPGGTYSSKSGSMVRGTGSMPSLQWTRGKNSFAREKENFIKEMRLLSKLRHPCITTVMGAVIAKGQDPLLVMEYMDNGSLRDILHNETMFMEGELVLHLLRDVAQGIRFLHSANPPVVHGDLKAANILVDSKFRAKVSDFGLSQRHSERATGTPFWMAPELLRGESTNTTASDMYAVGIILYELYSRKDPYDGEDDEEVLRLVCDRKVNKRPPIPSSCPPKIAKLMKFLLLPDPALRPTAEVLDNRTLELDAANVEPGQLHKSLRLRKEGENSTDILYQVFPRHIANVLKNGGKVEPESHEIVTIFFCDIVGFTNIASTSPPMKVSNMLDRIYTKFDDLASKFDLFKIETIGDAYMCASNLAKEQSDDHVKRIAEFAMEAVKAATETLIDDEDPSRGYMQIRVGFHSGPVVSNVVGNLNPRYSVFGDTVNVSSRMESTSEPGQIHCSERSAHILMEQAPKMSVRKRGETKIKGKGKMTTYWVC